jgi:ribosomal-protein-alanine N-acetyltransferase
MLTLEKLGPQHIEELAVLGNDPDISATSSVDYPCTHDTVQGWIDESSGNPPRRITFALRQGDHLVGACSLKEVDYEARTAEVSYWVAKPFWGQGLAKQALAALIRFAFRELEMQLLRAQCLRDNNLASLRVLERAGFTLDPNNPGHATRGRWGQAFPDDYWRLHQLPIDKWKALLSGN